MHLIQASPSQCFLLLDIHPIVFGYFDDSSSDGNPGKIAKIPHKCQHPKYGIFVANYLLGSNVVGNCTIFTSFTPFDDVCLQQLANFCKKARREREWKSVTYS